MTFESVKFVLKAIGQPTEAIWPYDPSGPTPQSPPANLGQLLRCTLRSHDTPQSIITSLANGVPVIVALELTYTWYSNLAPNYIIDLEPTNPNRICSLRHAVLAIGVHQDNRGNLLILIQNSWGNRWADNGCAWLSWDYVNRYFVGCMTVGSYCDE